MNAPSWWTDPPYRFTSEVGTWGAVLEVTHANQLPWNEIRPMDEIVRVTIEVYSDLIGYPVSTSISVNYQILRRYQSRFEGRKYPDRLAEDRVPIDKPFQSIPADIVQAIERLGVRLEPQLWLEGVAGWDSGPSGLHAGDVGGWGSEREGWCMGEARRGFRKSPALTHSSSSSRTQSMRRRRMVVCVRFLRSLPALW